MKTQLPQTAQTMTDADTPKPRQGQKKRELSWQFWGLILVFISGSVGYLATAALLKLSPTPNCATIYLPMTSAKARLDCARVEAEKGEVKNILKALAIVEKIPDDHPLQKTVQKYREEWAEQILALGEKEFQDGKLNEAIAIAQKIPVNSQAYQLVADRIKTWQEIWAQGEKLIKEAEMNLRQSEWNKAFSNAVSLTNLNNRYWSTTKYEELVGKISLARQESAKLDSAYVALRNGDADGLLKAIEIAGQIGKESYAYQEAQNLIDDARNKLLQKMQDLVKSRQWTSLNRIANQIPASLNLQDQVSGWNSLASAGLKAEIGTVESLEEAITEAQNIPIGNFLYEEAQELITRWQSETEAVTYLSQAQQLAQEGNKSAYQAAITEANLVPVDNPRYEEAQSQIRSWNRQIAIIEDQPILDLAKQWSRGGDLDSLQRAIAQARLISVNRPLYSEAKDLISQWQREIQTQQDRPILNEAIALGNAQEFAQAIQVAQRIDADRALYSEAQGKIQGWRREINANNTLQQAYQTAASGRPQDLAQAIRLVNNIPANTRVSSQGNQMSNRWGYQLLAIAQEQANVSIKDAIEIAKLIPASSDAYASAQAQIQGWENLLKPPVVIQNSTPLL